MLCGKAVARAIPDHFLVESALNILIIRSVLDTEIPPCTGSLSNDDIVELRSVYDIVVSTELNVNDCEYPECLIKLETVLCDFKSDLATKSKTAKLWLQYQQYITILKSLIRVERTCDWNLHLVTVAKTPNLFAATGHNNYAKCARLYLQMMLELPQQHPWLNDNLSDGYHAVRRSDRFWVGLSTEFAIESVMMRA